MEKRNYIGSLKIFWIKIYMKTQHIKSCENIAYQKSVLTKKCMALIGLLDQSKSL